MNVVFRVKQEKSKFVSPEKLIAYGFKKGFEELSINVEFLNSSFFNKLKSFAKKYDYSFSIFPQKPLLGRKKILLIYRVGELESYKNINYYVHFYGGKESVDKNILKTIPPGDQLDGIKPIKPEFKLPDKYLFFHGVLKYKRELSTILKLLSKHKSSFNFKIIVSTFYGKELSLLMNDAVKKGVHEIFDFIGEVTVNEFLYILLNSSALLNLSSIPENLFYISIAINYSKPVIVFDKNDFKGFDEKILINFKEFLNGNKLKSGVKKSTTHRWLDVIKRIIDNTS